MQSLKELDSIILLYTDEFDGTSDLANDESIGFISHE